ncbi:MAG: lysylphosphatidylglycerol synthase transmembrane domain-containing protein [Myxococcota bacterium]
MSEAERLDPERIRQGLRRGLWSVGIGLAVIVLAAVAIRGTEWGDEEIQALIQQADPGMLALSLLTICGAFCFMGPRWRALMPPPHQPPAFGLTAIICSGLLLNYAMPGPLGEVAAAWFAQRRYKVPLSDGLASGVAARMMGLATAALMALVIWLLVDLPQPTEKAEILRTTEWLIPIAALSIGAGGLALFWLAWKPHWWRRLSHRLLGGWAGDGRLATIARRIDGGVGTLAEALERVARRGIVPYLRAAGWSICAHSGVILGIYIAASGLGAEANLAGLSFTYVATTAGAVALFALPGSQVGWDFMFFSLLIAAAGLPAPVAAAVAVLVRVQQLTMMLLGAAALGWLLRNAAPTSS